MSSMPNRTFQLSPILVSPFLARPLLVATAGHVDHGKSTLVKTLTGTDPDRLPAEKTRGMTLDLGFASGPGISFVDCPGHDGLIRHLIAGQNAVDGVCLVIAINEGLCEQTMEHANVMNWLGIKKIFVVITKCDLVHDSFEVDWLREEILQGVRGLFGPETLIESALCSKNESGQDTLDKMKLFFDTSLFPSTNSYNRFFIDRSFVIKGTGPVVTGTFFEGQVSRSDKVILWLPKNKKSKTLTIKAVKCWDEDKKIQNEIGRTAFAVSGAAVEEIPRGSILLFQETLPILSQDLILQLEWLTPIKKQQTLTLQVGTLSLEAQLRLHPLGFWRCHLPYPAPLRRHDRVIIRQPERVEGIGHCVAGGMVIDSFAPSRKITLAPTLNDDDFINWCELHATKEQMVSIDFWVEKLGWPVEKIRNCQKLFPLLKTQDILQGTRPSLSPSRVCNSETDYELLGSILEKKWEAYVDPSKLQASHDLVKRNLVLHIKEGHFLHRDHYDVLMKWLLSHFSTKENLTIDDARIFFKIGRKSFIEILEFCDRLKFTYRKDLVRKKFKLLAPKSHQEGAHP